MYSLQMLTKLPVSPSEAIRGHRGRYCSTSVIANNGGAIPAPDRRWRMDGKRIPMLRFSADLISGSARSGRSRTEAASAGKPVQDQQQQMATDLDGGIVKDPRITKIASSIRVIPDFPKPGIIFQDITTLLLDHAAFKHTIDMFVERYQGKGISVVAGVEARGFIFGPPIALAIGAKFVPLRKPGKLPGKVISEEYSLEYGTDKMEMHVGAVEAGEKALIIDDLIATGGTLGAAIKLLERVGVEVVECACVIEIPELKGRDRLGDKPLFVLVSTE